MIEDYGCSFSLVHQPVGQYFFPFAVVMEVNKKKEAYFQPPFLPSINPSEPYVCLSVRSHPSFYRRYYYFLASTPSHISLITNIYSSRWLLLHPLLLLLLLLQLLLLLLVLLELLPFLLLLSPLLVIVFLIFNHLRL